LGTNQLFGVLSLLEMLFPLLSGVDSNDLSLFSHVGNVVLAFTLVCRIRERERERCLGCEVAERDKEIAYKRSINCRKRKY